MLAPPQRTIRLCGDTWTIRPPRKALDVLEATVYQYARVSTSEGASPSTEDMRMVLQWCAEHVISTSAQGDDARSMVDVVDECLDWPAIKEMREEIVDLGSIDSVLIEGVREYWRVSAGGGCECPRCKDGKDMSPERLAEFCLYEQIDEGARHLSSQVVGFTEDPDPSQPFWLFQLKQARLHGKLEARVEAKRRRDEGKKMKQLMKERGIR